MECSYCGNKIAEGETFYRYEDEVYCCNCTEVQTVTFYRFGGSDGWLHEDEEDIEEISDINFYVKLLKQQLDKFESLKQKENNEDVIKYLQDNIDNTNRILKMISK